MEVDRSETTTTAADVDQAQESALTSLSETLAQLEETPDNVPLLRRSINLMRTLNLEGELESIINRLSHLIMLEESLWEEYFAKLTSRVLTLESLVETLETLDRAEQDYLSAQSLVRHAKFLFAAKGDAEVEGFLTQDTIREMMAALVKKAAGLLDESQLVWDVWVNWEKSLDKDAEQLERIHKVYLAHLQVPHNKIQDTFDAYSSFCTENALEDYETRMVAATEASQVAKGLLGEKRYGKTRSDLEDALVATEISLQGPVWTSYIDWETDPKTKKANPELTRAVFERAVGTMAHAAGLAYSAYKAALPQKKKKKVSDEDFVVANQYREVARALKEAEAGFWSKYAQWAASSIEVYQRAVRACPDSGMLWSELLGEMEAQGEDIETLNECFERALNLGVLLQPRSPVGPTVELFVARIAYENRAQQSILPTAGRGLEAVAHLQGDPTCRLERFLLDWCENRSPTSIDEALSLLIPSKHRSASYQMVLARANVEARRGKTDAARLLYSSAIDRTDLDWPEAVYEAFTQLEQIHGTVDTLYKAKQAIRRQQVKLEKRRARAAEQYAQYAAPVVAAPVAVPTLASASNDAVVETNKEQDVKRDREHGFVLVSGLAADINISRIEGFLSDCGAIREVTIVDAGSSKSAIVEFRTENAVPLALAKDRKKLEGDAVNVSMLWRSTLYVTNFDKEVDDEKIRQLFGRFGLVLQTRWPSLKYASSRRFCYITMESPAAAQHALDLHGSREGSAFGLTVLISDPAVKKQRTDAGETTLFVGGLSQETTEEELREQFGKHGVIHYIKIGYDNVKKVSRGFAFIDMTTEAEAKAALDLNGAHLNGKFLRVSLKDSNHAAKQDDASKAAAERRARTVRLHNLPEHTQEGLLQQALGKIVPVKRLEVFARTREAIAELESAADTGKLLLRAEPFVFLDSTITFSESGRRKLEVKQDSKPAATLSFTPRNARKGKILGKGRPAATAAATPVETSGQDAFRALVDAKNKKREENLTAKRTADGEESQAKRVKRDE